MKINKILSIFLILTTLSIFLTACSPNKNGEDANTDLNGTYNITKWVSEVDGVASQVKEQIDAFEAANPGIVINALIEGVNEGDVASKVLTDVASAPDMYFFAQDQLSRLIQAAALAAPGKNAQEPLRENNDEISVDSSTVGGTIYAYPMTSDNGYFMYYDKSIISESDAQDMTKIIKACESAGKKFRFALENAWYTASFFLGAGCVSSWSTDSDGNFNGVEDDFNSDKGLIAMKGMMELTQSKCYDSDADVFTDAGVVISGIWNYGAASEFFGKNLGITDLPSYTVDGKSYHLGSFSGNKLLGVKPQSDAKKAAVLSKLALYLTGEECQEQRFDRFQWGPSNIKVQSSDKVKSNSALTALAEQNKFATPQGQIHGSWWDIAKVLGADAKRASSQEDLKKALNNNEKAISRIVPLTKDNDL